MVKKTIKEKLIGLTKDEAIDLLEKEKIEYEIEKKMSLKNDKVIEVEEENKKLIVKVGDIKGIILIIMLVLLAILSSIFAYNYFKNSEEEKKRQEQYEYVKESSAPEITKKNESWTKEEIIYVTKSAEIENFKVHEYCVVDEEDTSKCEWKEDKDNVIVISESGIWYVWFRGVSSENKYTKMSNEIIAYVDNETPELEKFEVTEISENKIKVEAIAKDNLSGIEKIEYSIDDENYQEASEFGDLKEDTTYIVYVRVKDKLGNEIKTSIEVKTLKQSSKDDETKEDEKEDNEKQDEENEKEKNWDIPKIDLNELPSVIEVGSKYDLPSNVDFGNDEGTYTCKIDEEETKDTTSLKVGRYKIECEAKSKHNKTTKVEKEILVQASEGEDEEKDGWIKLNLYYPVGSYNWEWRLGLKENDDDEEYEESDWQDYIGPILIKIEDINRVYIRYEKEGETFVVAPEGTIATEIVFEENPVTCGGTTKVKIEHEAADTVEYRINGGRWKAYSEELEINAGTIIEARTKKTVEVYNNYGEFSYRKQIEGYDRKTLKEVCASAPEERDVAINLNGVTSEIYLGESNVLPSYYSYGTHGIGSVTCLDENNNKVINTKYMSVGEHQVTCKLTASDNTSAGPVSKNFKIIEREYDPEISYEGIADVIVKGDSYALPSYYTYGSHGTGTITCKTNGNEISNTNELEVGTYVITCELIASDNTTLRANKTIVVKDGFEPYIDLNRLPSTIYQGDFYSIPSNYRYGRPDNGNIICKIDNVEMYDTHSLTLGTHNVECNIENGAGQRSSASKTINVIKRPIEPEPESILQGPTISGNPNNSVIVEETEITITTNEAASIIEYKIDNGSWTTYSEPFFVDKNCTIYARYIRASDGKQSQISSYYVSNIKQRNLPYVVINANPDYLSQSVTSTTITINAQDYDTLEYSFDNIVYQPYSKSFKVKESTTIYAKATNSVGTTTTNRIIVTKSAPKEQVELEVEIKVNPEKQELIDNNEITNIVEVEIEYDERATTKLYKIGNGNWQDYQGSFTLNKNETIYAYETSANGSGSTQKTIDYLTLSITQPKINIDIEDSSVYKVNVEIKYDDNAIIKRYRIISDDGTIGQWIDYEGPFEVNENCEIEAYQEDKLGNSNSSKKTINNIIPEPTYETIDQGDYYLIRLNYPSTSKVSAREYKWKSDGTWKSYDSRGIMLIKQESASNYNLNVDGMEIEDENGQTIIIPIDHVYVLDLPLSELSENLFMRWDDEKPQTPEIIIDKTSPATEVEVTINYAKTIMQKYYKIVYSDGTETEWKKYEGSFTIDKNNTTIYAYGKNRLEVNSEIAELKIENIDENAPEIEVSADFENPKQKVNVRVLASDDQEVYLVRWAKGRRTTSYFNEEDKGNTIVNGSTIQISENGVYTIYASDEAGNETLKEVEITNIDLDAPELTINILTSGISTSAEIEIEYKDSVIKKYSVGDNNNYQDYNGTITLSSYDYINKANSDGSLTIYAFGADEAGNVEEISEDIYCLDLDMPSSPVIVERLQYPTLTSEGFEVENKVEVQYENRNDTINEIKLGNNEWKTYTTSESITPVITVQARSRKKISNLTITNTRTINQLSNSLTNAAYDENNNTTQTIAVNSYATFKVENDGQIKKIVIRSNGASQSSVKIYGTDGSLSKTISIASNSQSVTLPSGTTKVEICAGSTALTINEVVLNGVIQSIEGDSILSILEDNSNLTSGYYTFKVDNETYPVHMYVLDGDQTISTNTTYGDSYDVGTSNSYAENMVIVKVNGEIGRAHV